MSPPMWPSFMMPMKIDKQNLQRLLDTIDTFNSTPGNGTTRLPFTLEDMGARSFVKQEMKALGLRVEEDAIGNLFGIWTGSQPELPMVWVGSHIDTVEHGGKFDGVCGVVCGLEAVRALQSCGARPKRSIAVVVYTAEEPTGFERGCLGSRALTHRLSLEDCRELFDAQGNSLYDILGQRGYDRSRFSSIPDRTKQLYAALELHVEQSSTLERLHCPVGIVKYICAPTNLKVTLRGRQAHAGGVSMDERQDAFMACAEIALYLEQQARQTESEYTAATIGEVEIYQGGSNIIPGKVTFSIDIRDCDGVWKRKLLSRLLNQIQVIAARRRVHASVKVENDDMPIACDGTLVALLEASCQEENIQGVPVISGAYHDSMFIGTVAPVAMLFVPSQGGVSHCPQEWTDLEDIEKGCQVLAVALQKIADQV